MKQAKLEDLFEYLPKSKIKAGDGLGEGKYPFYTSSETLSKYLNDFQHEPGCLVFGTGGKASVHLTTQRFSTSTDCITVKPKPSANIDVEYAFQYFRANMNVLENGFKGAGLKHISKAYLSAIEIPHSEDINDQRRIAYLLGKVEGLVAQRKQQLKQLDELLKGVFLEMFGFRNNAFIQLPTHKLGLLSDVISGVTKGKKYNPHEELVEVPYMRVANVQDGYFLLDEIKTISVTRKEFSQYQLKTGDVLLTEGGDPDKLGRGAVWKRQIHNCIHQNHIFRVRVNKSSELNPYYLSALIGSSYGKVYFLKSAKQTTGIASINSTQLKNFPVVLPPIKIQERFSEIVEKVESLKSLYHHNITDLELLYSALSQQAFKGELDLSNIALPEKKSFKVTRPIAPVVEDQFATAAQQAVSYLNQFNAGYSETLQKLQSAVSSSSILNNPTMRAIATLTEQVAQWRSPLDELKNMPSFVKAMSDITSKPSPWLNPTLLSAITESAKLSKKVADIVPNLDMGWLKEQQAIIEHATAPYASMQSAIASLGIMDNALSASYHSAMPDMSDYFNSTQSQLTTSSLIDEEPKHIFTHYDILDVLDAAGVSISSSELIQKLSELEPITLDDYERIKGLLFGLLNDGEIEQRCEENRVILSRIAV